MGIIKHLRVRLWAWSFAVTFSGNVLYEVLKGYALGFLLGVLIALLIFHV